jgi:hypothetical protein
MGKENEKSLYQRQLEAAHALTKKPPETHLFHQVAEEIGAAAIEAIIKKVEGSISSEVLQS